MPLAALILSFILGIGVGVSLWIVFALTRQKSAPQTPKDIESSLEKAKVIPPPPAPKPTESELFQQVRAETLKKKILYEEELSLMFKMGQDMFSGMNVENLVKVIAENANKIVNAEICTVLLEDKISGLLIPVYSCGVKPEILEKMRFAKGESISGIVAFNNEILVKNNINTDPWVKANNRGEFFVNSLLSIPLKAKDKVIGVLNLSSKKSGQPFTDDEVAFIKGLTAQGAVALQNAQLYEQVQENYLRTITALAFALDARDSYTREHSENVTRYAVAIAQEMNLKSSEVERIRRAGLLHDIGKIGIRDGVLLKPGKLTDEEYKDIQNHPGKGEAIVNALPFLKEEAKLIRHHHEKFDGTGYPDKISGMNIEIGARILAVADSFDAMIQSRVYRKALSLDVACQELEKNKGKQFDPDVVDALLRIIQKNPGMVLR